ncbi:MFS transporter [Humibacter sp.]|uniref:MFS transporter n=1 Tax=Humibacter sp. TaxID=1940291 RepID=UPI003F822EDD
MRRERTGTFLTAGPTLTAALCGGYFLVLLDVTVVNVALPSIGAGFGVHSPGLVWVVDAYTVPLAALLLAAGAIGDRLGHRRIVIAGFLGFGLASVVCAIAPAWPVLVAGRALQGVCAALVLPGTLALLVDRAGDGAARSRVVGVWAAIGGAALPAGPLVGGLLVASAGWRAVFWLNVPVVVAALVPVVASRSAEKPRVRRNGRVDWFGAVTLTVMLAALVTAVVQLEEPVLAGAAIALVVVAALALWWVERRARHPLLRVPKAARRPLLAACGVAGLMNFSVLGALFVLTQTLQDVRHLSPLAAGLLLLPGMLPLPLLGAPAGRMVARIGRWRTAAVGLVIAAFGFAGLAASIRVAEPVWLVVLAVSLVVWGAGIGILTPAVVAAALAALPDASGAASGASNTARQVGGALGVAVFGVLAGDASAAAFVPRVSWMFAAAAVVFAAIASACIVVSGSRRRLRPGGETELVE